MIRVGLLAVLLTSSAAVHAAEKQEQERPRDAAEVVQEGDVSQWLKYYQRERGMPVPAPAPQSPPVSGEATDRDEPAPGR